MVTLTPSTQQTEVQASAAAGRLVRVCRLGGQWCNGNFLACHAADPGSSTGHCTAARPVSRLSGNGNISP